MLALNAAIEAARAGARAGLRGGGGRGASSRRTRSRLDHADPGLVTRIATESGATAMVAEEGQREVDRAREVAHEAAAALDRIAGMVDETTTATREISIATQQQRSASDQVVLAMGQVSDASRQYAVGLAAGRGLRAGPRRLAESMRGTIDTFNVAPSEHPHQWTTFDETTSSRRSRSARGARPCSSERTYVLAVVAARSTTTSAASSSTGSWLATSTAHPCRAASSSAPATASAPALVELARRLVEHRDDGLHHERPGPTATGCRSPAGQRRDMSGAREGSGRAGRERVDERGVLGRPREVARA